jgi:alanyl-tRNA synthetase
MHAALREILGEHVQQKGSLVDARRLRFDFSHFEAVTEAQLRQIEDRVNEQIRLNTAVETTVTDIETARNKGAMMLFGEKYGDAVRVLSMGDSFSVELCGGTHVQRTGDIGLMRIGSESGIAAGVRRIEAVTGVTALQVFNDTEQQISEIASSLKTSTENVSDKVRQLIDSNRELEKELARLKGKLASSAGSDLASQAKEVAGVKVLAARLDGADGKSLRTTMDQLKNKLGSAVILLSAVDGDKISLVAGVTDDLTGQYKAGALMQEIAPMLGGKGGGRPDMAQGGGNNPAALPAALEHVGEWVAGQ